MFQHVFTFLYTYCSFFQFCLLLDILFLTYQIHSTFTVSCSCSSKTSIHDTKFRISRRTSNYLLKSSNFSTNSYQVYLSFSTGIDIDFSSAILVFRAFESHEIYLYLLLNTKGDIQQYFILSDASC